MVEFNWELIKVIALGVGWWLIPLIWIFVYRAKLRKYPIEAHIFERRGKGLVYSKDMLGRMKDPTHSYRFKMNKTTIPIPKYDWIMQAVGKPTNYFEKFVNMLIGRQGVIFLFKYGSDQYKPINVKHDFVEVHFETIDWDDINHMTQELRAIQERRQKSKDFISRYGPIIGLAIIAMVFIVAMYLGINYIKEAGGVYMEASRQASGFQPVVQETPETVEGDPLDITTPLDALRGNS